VDKRMDELKEIEVEDRLRQTLRHVEAPPGFTDRVMARVAEREAGRTQRDGQRKKVSRGFVGMHRQAGWWTAVAAALVLSLGGGAMFQHHQREQEAEAQVQEAQAQLDLALQLTSHALNQVQGGLDRSPAGQILKGLDK
jgi:anti-sigma-K factor RskA